MSPKFICLHSVYTMHIQNKVVNTALPSGRKRVVISGLPGLKSSPRHLHQPLEKLSLIATKDMCSFRQYP